MIAAGAIVVPIDCRRGGRSHLLNKHLNKDPKGQNGRAPRSGIIAVFSILTPSAQGVKNRMQ